VATVAEVFAHARKLQEAGSFPHAEQLYRQILKADPSHANAWCFLGILQYEQGQLEEAALSFRQLILLQPSNAEAQNNLGFVFDLQQKYDEAIAHYREALRLNPLHDNAHYNLAIVLHKQGKLDEARAGFQQALRVKPDDVAAQNNLGVVLMDLGQVNDAVLCFRQALRLDTNHVEALTNLGNAVARQDKLDESIRCYEQALRLKPNSAAAWTNLGNVRRQQGRFDEALACYARALSHDPGHAETHLNRAHLLLLLGQWAQGWPEFEWRWQTTGFIRPNFRQPRWDGSPLAGRTLLVLAEQGLGDTLHFIRYAPLVKQLGGKVIVQCQPPLLRLLAGQPGIDLLCAAGSPSPTFDCYVPLLSLPGLFHTSVNNVPATVPYLQPDTALVSHWRQELHPLEGFKVGIAWQGNPAFPGDSQRSLPLAQFECLSKVPGVRLISLQKGPGTDQLRTVTGQFSVLDLSSRLDEANGPFMDTAAIMKDMDLVIASDTAVAHLAGALGVPVWVPLPWIPDWRWLLQREDSPWYPTMRVFRQTTSGRWDDVMDRLAAELTVLAAGQTTPRPD
jgi:tetratricopeptide (TPR) repeat protein